MMIFMLVLYSNKIIFTKDYFIIQKLIMLVDIDLEIIGDFQDVMLIIFKIII